MLTKPFIDELSMEAYLPGFLGEVGEVIHSSGIYIDSHSEDWLVLEGGDFILMDNETALEILEIL